MAESDVRRPTETVEEEGTNNKLKYLDFIQVAALYVIACLAAIYEYAKENSGSVKSGVHSVESTVKSVTGPVYRKFHGVPFKILKFLDDEIDLVFRDFDRLAPSPLKRTAENMMSAAQKAREVVTVIQQDGVVTTAKNVGNNLYIGYEPKVKDLYVKYEPKVADTAVRVWRLLNQFPLFHQVAVIIVPTVGHWCEKYNESLAYAWEKGYTGSHYLPLIPVEKIGKAFEGGEKISASTSDDESRSVSNRE